MGDNKMLGIILEKIGKIFDKTYSFHELNLLCELITVGIDDNDDMEYAISFLKNEQNKIKNNLELRKELNLFPYEMTIENTLKNLEQRQESVKLLQEGYSGGKCIL